MSPRSSDHHPTLPHKTRAHRWCAVLVLALVSAGGCDSKSEAAASKDEAAKSAETAPAVSESAKAVNEAIEEMKAELAKGETIYLSCAGEMGAYGKLSGSSNADEKKAYQALLDVCYVDAPKKVLADLRAKLAKGEYDGLDAVDLTTVIDDDKRPQEGAAAEVAADAKKFLQVEVPTVELAKHTKTAEEEKAAGEMVSMGCIEGKQVVGKFRASLEADDAGKAALAAYDAVCPAKE